MKRGLMAVGAVVLLTCSLPTVSVAAQRCPAGSSGCNIDNAAERIQDRVKQGRDDVRNASGPIDKAKAAGATVRDCLQCGTDAVRGAVKK